MQRISQKMKKDDFISCFNRAFWKAFTEKAFPIIFPKTQKEKKLLIETLYEDIESSRYSPSIPEAELIMNKGYGVARTIPVFCIQDYCVYFFCIKELESVLCINRTPNTFGGWSLGGKLRTQENEEIEDQSSFYGRYSFNPQAWTKAFGQFNALLFAQLEPENFSYALQLDLSNFYDSVRLDILERWIREQSPSEKGWVITLLFYFLNHWNRKNTGLHPQIVGLPQDALADCSRILSNFYLQKYDCFVSDVCSQIGAIYFRYADDQIILLNDQSYVENLLLLLTRKLDHFGLRVNQKKVNLWKTSALIKHRCRDLQAIFSKEGDNKNPILVRKFTDAYLKLSPEKLNSTWNSGTPLLNRLLFANIDSLPPTILEKLMIRITSESFLLLADAKKLERIFFLNSLRKEPIDLINRIKVISNKSVHNAFHYEARHFARTTDNKVLEVFLDERIEKLNQMMASNTIEKIPSKNLFKAKLLN
jgi:hypothetical protein